MSDPLQARKASLRSHSLALRAAIPSQAASAAAQALVAQLQSCLSQAPQTIAAYIPVRGEMDILPACRTLLEQGHHFCLPVTEEKHQPLRFRRWLKDVPLVSGLHGIMVPPEGEPQVVPQVLLIPLLAFDAKGHRLGYGAGYYDRTMHALRGFNPALVGIGIGYSAQQVDEVPAGPHDEMLDMVVTEHTVMNFG